MQLIIPAVADLILSKRHIADGKVKEVVRQVGFFIPCNLDFCFLVKLLCDTTGQAVQLHAVQLGIVGIELAVPVPEERADTHAGLQHIAAHAADMLQGAVHSVNDRRRCVKCCQGGFPRGGVFILGQQGFQLLVLGMPVILAGVKGICQTAPAKITSQNVLFLLGCGGSTGCHALLDFFQRADGLHIDSELCFRTFRHGRFIRCKVVRAIILGRFLTRSKAVYILHDLRYKGGFLRFVCADFGFLFLDFVDVHFHQTVKIEIGKYHPVHIFQRSVCILCIEGIVHKLADRAMLQIRIDLNRMLLVLGGGVAKIDLGEVGKIWLCDFKLILEIVLDIGESLFTLLLHQRFTLLLR